MPRKARKKSETGIYHVIFRGINQQQIFEDSEDYGKFLKILKDCKAISEFKIFAYCLMGNHIHLLIQEDKEPIEQVMKRIATRFVYWYNIKYRRAGHLFQDRFKSEPVEDDAYFLTVIRYIHQNPIKAGISDNLDYEYSSYNEFTDVPDIVDCDFVFDMVLKEDFIAFNNQNSLDKCLDIESKPIVKVTDEQARRIIEKYSKCKSIAEFQALDVKTRDRCLGRFRENGLSIRQISRLTGVSIGIVRNSHERKGKHTEPSPVQHKRKEQHKEPSPVQSQDTIQNLPEFLL
ncbi:MAG: transposase [Acutalibacteraceae bacterium]